MGGEGRGEGKALNVMAATPKMLAKMARHQTSAAAIVRKSMGGRRTRVHQHPRSPQRIHQYHLSGESPQRIHQYHLSREAPQRPEGPATTTTEHGQPRGGRGASG